MPAEIAVELGEIARSILKSQGYFVDKLWHCNDIYFLCEQIGVPAITQAEAETVFAIANEQFDGEYGINWPQLEKALNTYLQRKEMLQQIAQVESLGDDASVS